MVGPNVSVALSKTSKGIFQKHQRGVIGNDISIL